MSRIVCFRVISWDEYEKVYFNEIYMKIIIICSRKLFSEFRFSSIVQILDVSKKKSLVSIIKTLQTIR